MGMADSAITNDIDVNASSDEHSNEMCNKCGDGDSEKGNEILLCDGAGCKAAFHLKCLPKPLHTIPEGKWYCPACRKRPGKGPRREQGLDPKVCTQNVPTARTDGFFELDMDAAIEHIHKTLKMRKVAADLTEIVKGEVKDRRLRIWKKVRDQETKRTDSKYEWTAPSGKVLKTDRLQRKEGSKGNTGLCDVMAHVFA